MPLGEEPPTAWPDLIGTDRQDPAQRSARLRRRLALVVVPLVYLGCTAAFVADLQRADTLAFGVFYIPLVATAVFYRQRAAVWWLTAIACSMVVVGTFVPYMNPDLYDLLGNRFLSVIAILATALFVRHARAIQERLAEQTQRAESAERIKTNVFLNLSQEIRTPLHSMIGLLQVVSADCRPDQRLPLNQVQGAGRRLLGTIENLIDLTGVDQHTLHPEPLDLASLLRQVVEAQRTGAAERQIVLEPELPPAAPPAFGDLWATRRILDNLLTNAIKFSPPGQSVHVGLRIGSDALEAVIEDNGKGMAPDVLRRLGEPYYQAMLSEGTGTGLALSRRLADQMHAELLFDSQAGVGTIARLRLPRPAAA
jgi:signal transduction histidine kinase